MAETIDEISVNYEEDGKVIVEQLDKEILSKGAWTTIIFKFRQWDNKKDDYGPERFTIRRYRKLKGEYKQQTKFNISSKDQAEKIVAALQKWI
ncbi:hypothetical protein MHK_007001 [Candidatus Magnetomorum sp. HK-1]|nr:hypothetical protein MHK_007001 [Candidatus Magnetomorum sp. HK-1]